ncbi:hypothetical protein DL769_002150 [Monosporascus sp. CRB-8-3]|nr:hypothetical protein DL769_002150 [Monosporascus sp. CRB-8-3]
MIAQSTTLKVQGSTIDWGTREPSLVHILNEYKRLYQVAVNTPSASSSDSETDNGRGGSGGGAGGRGGKHWTKQIYKNNDGSYFYNDANGNCRKCDKYGNDTPEQWDAISSRRTAQASSSSYARTSNNSYSASSSSRSAGSSSAASSQRQYYKDRSGRLYYVDQNGRTQWA